MEGKFKIFCDSETNNTNKSIVISTSNAGKREPLGLRQDIAQKQLPAQPLPATSQSSSSSSTTDFSSSYDEDQENDISMASLGSDYVPSILHDDAELVDDHSFEMEEEQVTHYSLTTTENDLCDDGALIAEDDLVDNDEEYYDDEELQLELSQAFKRHDDSLLFKSSVYIHDIDAYLSELEKRPDLRALPNYMTYQTDLDSKKRTTLINWLIEVSDEYELKEETLFICVNLIDRFLSEMAVPTKNFQLLGVAAMFIASKYEEIYPPTIRDLVEVTDETYSGRQICRMEQEILKALNFKISVPTVTFFLKRIFAFNKFTKKVYHLAEYLCYLSLLEDRPFLEYHQSEIAISAVILAAHTLDAAANISKDLKNAYDQANQAQLERRNLPEGTKMCDIDRRAYTVDGNLPFCIEALRNIQERMYQHAKGDATVYVSYSLESHSRVSLIAPAKAEDLLNY